MLALGVDKDALAAYPHRLKLEVSTQPQVLACLLLKESSRTE